MKTKQNNVEEKNNSKRGTIGYAINQLVKKYGNGTNGIYILEQALARVTGAEVRFGGNNGVMIYETPGYKKHRNIEQLILQRIGEIPAAACPGCGGWSNYGGMSQHFNSDKPINGRTGCGYAHPFLVQGKLGKF